VQNPSCCHLIAIYHKKILYPSLVLCNEDLSVFTYHPILLGYQGKMNWKCVLMEGLRIRTGLKLVTYNKCSGLVGSALPDHTSSFFLLSSIKAQVFCLGFTVCLLWLMLHRVFSFMCMRTER